MRVIVTRPGHEARDWAQRLRDAGFDAVALPLIAIEPAADALAVARAWDSVDACAAVMFVSGNAVREFFRVRPRHARFGARAWAPGPGTAQALADAGVDASLIDVPGDSAAQFDSETLWQQVGTQLRPGSRLLIVRGGDAEGAAQGRDWLVLQAQARGAFVDQVAAYRRVVPAWSAPERESAAQAAGPGHAWLFSSSEAVRNLVGLVPGQSWAAARALATHPRIAQAVLDAGFGRVEVCRPAFADVVAALESAG